MGSSFCEGSKHLYCFKENHVEKGEKFIGIFIIDFKIQLFDDKESMKKIIRIQSFIRGMIQHNKYKNSLLISLLK